MEAKLGTGRDDRAILLNLLGIDENCQHLKFPLQMSNHAKVLRDIGYV